MSVRLGVIADDVTGACDLAGGVAAQGIATSVFLGVPEDGMSAEDDCIVVGLKTRTIPRAEAAEASVAAAKWLRGQGVEQLYQKYCSTFDSTDAGNIGPVADALAASLGGSALTVGTPATPAAGRTQYLGHLFVGRQLLSESPMKDHPLTPMRDSDLVAVLSRQTPGAVALVPLATVRAGAGALADAISGERHAGAAHVLVDAIDDADLDLIAEATTLLDQPIVLGGGAGIAVAIARRAARSARIADAPPVADGARLILSGSASARTREQVAAFAGPTIRLDPLRLATDGPGEVETELARLLDTAVGDPVLVSATDEPDRVRAVQDRLGTDQAAALIEGAIGRLAILAVERFEVRRIIVAGGETSGSVAAALGISRLAVGRLAAPGVPWTTGTANAVAGSPAVALLLKSGNFGQVDLFSTGWETAP